jgi:hypothetical protein
VDCKILRVSEEEDEEYRFTVELTIKTTHNVFFNKKGRLLGLLCATQDPIDLSKVVRMYFRDCRKEVVRRINEFRKKKRV